MLFLLRHERFIEPPLNIMSHCLTHIRAPYFFNPRREVLNKQLAQVVEGLEFAGLKDRRRGGEEDNSACCETKIVWKSVV